MKDLAVKRHNDWKKAIRKRNICIHEYGQEYYDNLHQYSKNKIHCSCALYTAKTNTKINKSKGPVSNYTRTSRLATTNNRNGKKNYKVSDLKKIQRLNFSLEDYYKGEHLHEAI